MVDKVMNTGKTKKKIVSACFNLNCVILALHSFYFICTLTIRGAVCTFEVFVIKGADVPISPALPQ